MISVLNFVAKVKKPDLDYACNALLIQILPLSHLTGMVDFFGQTDQNFGQLINLWLYIFTNIII